MKAWNVEHEGMVSGVGVLGVLGGCELGCSGSGTPPRCAPHPATPCAVARLHPGATPHPTPM